MKATRQIQTREELIELVREGISKRVESAITVQLWDGRILTADHYEVTETDHPCLQVDTDAFSKTHEITRLVDALLKRQQTFVTVVGARNFICALKWSTK